MQQLVPSTPWDWPTDSLGTSSAALYDFCSWMPQSSLPSALYQPSTIRFSDAYQVFLSALDEDLMVETARRDYMNQQYYTQVLYSQAAPPLMPTWNVSKFPSQWVPTASTAGTIRVKLPDLGEATDSQPEATVFGVRGGTEDETPVPLRPGRDQYVDIYADAWGWISIRPGGWYKSAVVEFKAKGPYKTGNAEQFFGKDGLLRCLLTGIYVALHPSVTASVEPAFASELQDKLKIGQMLRVAGIIFDVRAVTFSGLAPSVTTPVTMSASAGSALTATGTRASTSDPIMVGAAVAELGQQAS